MLDAYKRKAEADCALVSGREKFDAVERGFFASRALLEDVGRKDVLFNDLERIPVYEIGIKKHVSHSSRYDTRLI